MKRILLLISLVVGLGLHGQNLQKPSDYEISTLPLWAQKMYSEHPNVYEVDALVKEYYQSHPFVKTYHTQYYKRWKRSLRDLIGDDGFPVVLTEDQTDAIRNEYLALNQHESPQRSSTWSVVGPITNYQEGLEQGSGQTNVYSFDQCVGSPAILYCGTEPGEVYKSSDGGNNWNLVSASINFGSGVTAVEVDPTNGQIVFAGGNLGVFRSTDGGANWQNVLLNTNLGVNEILINPGNTQIVMAATDKGLFRSTDGGTNWTELFAYKSYDLKVKTNSNSTIFLVRNNPVSEICEFAISTDSGATWTIQTSGWYTSNDPARYDGGARIAVSPANPQRVYAYLIGESKPDDYGYIGVYRSDDGGVSWALPNGPVGGPYDDNHKNLAIGTPDWLYHQGFYNCAIMADPTDEDIIIVGGLNSYKSTDGGATFTAINGYVGGPLSMHVDNQDFRVIGNEHWITTDGGVYHSTDFFATQPDFLMSGVHGAEYWGFGSGWNEDVLVGGLYHNGNIAYYENYGPGNFLELGGGEASTGYVNPGNSRRTYFSDIDGEIIPVNLADPITNAAFGIDPNESYWAAESSELEFHPNCYNVAFTGKDSAIWKTTDGGGSFQLLHVFSNVTDTRIAQIEIASDNPDVMFTHLRPASGSTGSLWKTTDAGQNWTQLTIPSGNSSRMLIALDPANNNRIWIAYPSGSNSNKVFESVNGGTTWQNITSSTLNGESPHSLVYVVGTTGGLYLAGDRAVYYRNSGSNWQLDNSGLPTYTNGNLLRPFYRDGKMRLATYGKGIWESPLSEEPTSVIARIMVDKLEQEVTCAADSFYFDDYSFINHAGATWQWTFPTGSPSSSTLRNPVVSFTQPGSHLAVLQITDGNGNTDTDSLYVQVTYVTLPVAELTQDFQGNFLPYGWSLENPDEDGQWTLSYDAGGYGNSTQSAIFDNYNIYGDGNTDDMIIPVNASAGISEMIMTFDVAYARWGGANSDTLSIHVSTDCGATTQQVFYKGGTDLATSPDFQDYFIPTANQWRTETVDLSNYIGEQQLQIIFRNHGYYGNVLYIDNINLNNDLSVSNPASITLFNIFPNPVQAGSCLHIQTPESGTLTLIDAQGKKLATSSGNGNCTFDIPAHLAQGTYTLQFTSAMQIVNKRIVITK